MNQNELIKQVEDIKKMMEKSSKFMSISGISGILIGIYALLGSFFVQRIIKSIDKYISLDNVFDIFGIAVAVLVLSIITGIIMAQRKAAKSKQSVWNTTSKSLFIYMCIPLLAGGAVAAILLIKGYYSLIASILLLFYGLSLLSASHYSFKELAWLGVLDIILGLLALWWPSYGLYFWATGFGILHIVYGIIVYNRYEK